MLMIRSRQMEFGSRFDMEQSLVRLTAATDPPRFHRGRPHAAAGSVERGRVVLSRPWPYLQFYFKPFFHGQFEERDGRVVLAGRFQLRPHARAMLWYAVGVLVALAVVVQLAANTPADAVPVLRRLLIPFAALALFVAVVTWVGATDIAFVSRCIRRALSDESQDEWQR